MTVGAVASCVWRGPSEYDRFSVSPCCCTARYVSKDSKYKYRLFDHTVYDLKSGNTGGIISVIITEALKKTSNYGRSFSAHRYLKSISKIRHYKVRFLPLIIYRIPQKSKTFHHQSGSDASHIHLARLS